MQRGELINSREEIRVEREFYYDERKREFILDYGARARAGGTCLVAVLHAGSVIGCWGRAAGAASVIVCW